MQLIPLIVGLMLLGSITGCTIFDEKSRRIADAQRRLRNGELVSKVPNGRHAEGFGEYSKILKDEHGLQFEGTLGDSDEYVQGFNSVMKPEIDKRFDREFFDRIWKQAVDKHAKKNQE